MLISRGRLMRKCGSGGVELVSPDRTLIVQCDLLSDDFRVGAVTLPPQPMAKDDYTISARPVFFG